MFVLVSINLMMRGLLRKETSFKRFFDDLLIRVLPFDEFRWHDNILLFWFLNDSDLILTFFSSRKHERVDWLSVFLFKFFNSIRVS